MARLLTCIYHNILMRVFSINGKVSEPTISKVKRDSDVRYFIRALAVYGARLQLIDWFKACVLKSYSVGRLYMYKVQTSKSNRRTPSVFPSSSPNTQTPAPCITPVPHESAIYAHSKTSRSSATADEFTANLLK